MSWRVTSREDPHRWVGWTDDEGGLGQVDGDQGSLEALADLIDSTDRVALTPTGPFRDVLGMEDQVGVYLFARQVVVPGPHEIIGTPPWENTGAIVPEGAVA